MYSYSLRPYTSCIWTIPDTRNPLTGTTPIYQGLRNPLGTAVYLDTHQLTIHNCLYMRKSTQDSRVAYPVFPESVVCPKDGWALAVEWWSGWGRGVGGFSPRCRPFPHPLFILSITPGIELIVMAAPDPWPPIGSWLPWATGLSLGLLERHGCKMGAGLLGPLCYCLPRCPCLRAGGADPQDLPCNTASSGEGT